MPAVFVVAPVFAMWTAEARKSPYRETGGILIGYRSSAGDIVVTHTTGPGPQAHRTVRGIELDGKYCQDQLAGIYRASNGTFTFLGDWHSHPFGTLKASDRDRTTLRSIRSDPRYRSTDPLMVICGPTWRASGRQMKRQPALRTVAYTLAEDEALVTQDLYIIASVPGTTFTSA